MDMNLLSRASVVSSAWRYCLAAASCGLALAVALPTGEASSCFLPAVMVSSLIGGKGPGFLPPLFHSASLGRGTSISPCSWAPL